MGQGETLLLRDARDGVATDPNSEVHEEMMGLTFKFRAGEFFQNNPFVIPKMVEYTVAQVCGAGSILLRLPITSCCFLLLLASPARV